MSRRGRAARELLILATLSVSFLLVFPKRPIIVDMTLAFLALGLVLLNAKSIRAEAWQPLRPAVEIGCCLRSTMIPTAFTMLMFLLIGTVIGYQGAGWPGARARILHPHMPMAIIFYLPWALIQQVLFQFYLLGRMRVLCPSLPPLYLAGVNGLAFGLAHMTNPWIPAMAGLGGAFWSVLYLRCRLLWPLAISHALVAVTFFYWVYGRDVASQWNSLILSLMNVADTPVSLIGTSH
jgi:hypothetical protein